MIRCSYLALSSPQRQSYLPQKKFLFETPAEICFKFSTDTFLQAESYLISKTAIEAPCIVWREILVEMEFIKALLCPI